MSPKIVLGYISAQPHKIKQVLSNLFSVTSAPIYVYLCYSGQKIDIEENENIKIEYVGLIDKSDIKKDILKKAIVNFNVQGNDLLGMWADDFEAQSGWAEKLLNAYKNNPSKDFISVNDSNHHLDYTFSLWYHSPVSFMSKDYLYDINDGNFTSKFYTKSFYDSDNSQISMLLGRHQFVKDIIILHTQNEESDKTAVIKQDFDIYKSRRNLFLNLLTDQKFSTWRQNWRESDLAHQILTIDEQIKYTNIIEVGTFVGYTTKYFAKLFPNIPIATIEVSPYCVEDSKEELKNFENVNIIHGFSISFGECYAKLIKQEEKISRYLRYNNFGNNHTNILDEMIEKSERPFFVFNSSLTTELEIEKVINHCKQHNKPFAFLIANQVANPYLSDRITDTYLGDNFRISWKKL